MRGMTAEAQTRVRRDVPGNPLVLSAIAETFRGTCRRELTAEQSSLFRQTFYIAVPYHTGHMDAVAQGGGDTHRAFADRAG